MKEKQQPANSPREARKAYQTLKLVQHGHFLDVVKDLANTDGSQLEKQPQVPV